MGKIRVLLIHGSSPFALGFKTHFMGNWRYSRLMRSVLRSVEIETELKLIDPPVKLTQDQFVRAQQN